MARLISYKILGPLHGRAFRTYRELEEEILKQFNKHLDDNPPGYTHMQLIEWGEKQGWIRKEGNVFVVFYDKPLMGVRSSSA